MGGDFGRTPMLRAAAVVLSKAPKRRRRMKREEAVELLMSDRVQDYMYRTFSRILCEAKARQRRAGTGTKADSEPKTRARTSNFQQVSNDDSISQHAIKAQIIRFRAKTTLDIHKLTRWLRASVRVVSIKQLQVQTRSEHGAVRRDAVMRVRGAYTFQGTIHRCCKQWRWSGADL